jgi:ribosome-associated heat shock protein Hsp15
MLQQLHPSPAGCARYALAFCLFLQFNCIAVNTKEKLRIDKYLWAIRIFKTRSQAAEACDKGRVKMSGESVKASRTVHVGDRYEIKTEARRWEIEVSALLHNRMQFAEASKYYIDHTPPEEKERLQFMAASFHTGKRQSKIGRPTKKQRRDIDEFLGE